MRNVWAIYKREMRSYFISPMAYAIYVIFLALCGFFFYSMVSYYARYSMMVMQQRQYGANLPAFTEQVLALAQGAQPEGPHPIGVVEAPAHQRWVVFEARELIPVTEDVYESLRDRARGMLLTQRKADARASWYSRKNIRQRAGFAPVRSERGDNGFNTVFVEKAANSVDAIKRAVLDLVKGTDPVDTSAQKTPDAFGAES